MFRTYKIATVGSIAKKINSKNSYVSITLNNKTIYLASSHYREGMIRAKAFYEKNNITYNLNLLNHAIPHGTMDDTPENTLPKFYAAAKELRMNLSEDSAVLVNCQNGRSRTGSVVALYLMVYENLSAEDAIDLVNKALAKRGYHQGIDLKDAVNGSYADWLRDLEESCKEQSAENRFFKIAKQSPILVKTMGLDREANGLAQLKEDATNLAARLEQA